MAGDWIKMRSGMDHDFGLFRVSDALNIGYEHVFYKAFKLAAWVSHYGEYGKLMAEMKTVDAYVECEGFAEAMQKIGYLKFKDGLVSVHKYCEASALRKGFGVKVRRSILDGAVCAACGCSERLEIDHITPIARGGSNDLSNLQALCTSCNRSKWKMTMDEFMSARSAA